MDPKRQMVIDVLATIKRLAQEGRTPEQTAAELPRLVGTTRYEAVREMSLADVLHVVKAGDLLDALLKDD